MADLLQDLRYGFRQLLQNPGFTVAAALCIALGIGANTATFSYANSLLMYEAPVEEPDRLVRMFIDWSTGMRYGSWSYPDYEDFRDRADVFSDLIAEKLMPLHFSHEGRNQRVWASCVSGNYFSALGVSPSPGRGFLPEDDDTRGTHPVIVLNHAFWQTRFGADPEVIGAEIVINGSPFIVIGIAPEGFRGLNIGLSPDVWVPFAMWNTLVPGYPDMFERRGSHGITGMVGRLAPGVTIEQAREASIALAAQLTEEYPDSNVGKSVSMFRESEASLHPMVRGGFVSFIALLFGVVGFILLLACANVAGLMLARAAARRREIGIRLSLGASRLRLVRQLMTESSLLALLSGALGLLLGYVLVKAIETIEPPGDSPFDWSVGLDARVLGFTIVAAVLTGILFGLVPALQSTRQDLVSTLKEAGDRGSRQASWLRRGLVVFQVALSLVLLIGSALVVRSLQNVRDLDLGLEPDNLLIAALDLDLQGYDQDEARGFRRDLKERLLATPGVTEVGYGELIPLRFMMNQWGVHPEGYEIPEGESNPSIDVNMVGSGYFAAAGIPLLQGRPFDETDDEDGAPVMIINEAFAERFWPGESGLGKMVRTGGEDKQVIGIVPTGKYFSIGEDPKAYMYFPELQWYRGSMYAHVRTAGDPTPMLDTVRRNVVELDSTLPISDLTTMYDAMGFALLPASLAATVISGFAVLALILAAIGLYGIVAFSVSQGTRDIGIRMALGARAGSVLGLVMQRGLLLVGIGLAVGLAGGFALTRLMTAILYGVSPTDTLSFVVAAGVLAAVALLATFLPARRATRVDPMVALRVD